MIIGNVGKTACLYECAYTLFESRYTLQKQYVNGIRLIWLYFKSERLFNCNCAL